MIGERSKHAGEVKMFGVLDIGFVDKSIGPNIAVKAFNIAEVISPVMSLSLKSIEMIRGSVAEYEQTTAFSFSKQLHGSFRYSRHLNQFLPSKAS